MDVFEQQRTFMDAANQKSSSKAADLYFNLIHEEVRELNAAVENNDCVEIADALTDILVVTIGMMHALDLPARALWDEVMRSNFAKIGADGKVKFREDGKVLKPEGWTPPDLARVLQERKT
jgi:predicted HAD superfamily Cof-like phosphohydrolase